MKGDLVNMADFDLNLLKAEIKSEIINALKNDFDSDQDVSVKRQGLK